jgi:hypothetical protein
MEPFKRISEYKKTVESNKSILSHSKLPGHRTFYIIDDSDRTQCGIIMSEGAELRVY